MELSKELQELLKHNEDLSAKIEIELSKYIGKHAKMLIGKYKGYWGRITAASLCETNTPCFLINPYNTKKRDYSYIANHSGDSRTYWRFDEVGEITDKDIFK